MAVGLLAELMAELATHAYTVVDLRPDALERIRELVGYCRSRMIGVDADYRTTIRYDFDADGDGKGDGDA